MSKRRVIVDTNRPGRDAAKVARFKALVADLVGESTNKVAVQSDSSAWIQYYRGGFVRITRLAVGVNELEVIQY